MYASILCLDDNCADQIRKIREPLKNFGFPLHPADEFFWPHITLTACLNLDLESFRPALENWVKDTNPINVKFSALGIFPQGDHAVLYLTPSIPPGLSAARHSYYDKIMEHAEEYMPYYRPENWVPHSTLSEQVPVDRLNDLVQSARNANFPIEGVLDRVLIVHVPDFENMTAEIVFEERLQP